MAFIRFIDVKRQDFFESIILKSDFSRRNIIIDGLTIKKISKYFPSNKIRETVYRGFCPLRKFCIMEFVRLGNSEESKN